MEDKNNTFQNRWLIVGRITTEAPLHIGSGETIPFKALKDVECSSVATDCNDMAYIPGTTLKGNLRAWLEVNGFDKINDKVLSDIFGSRAVGEDSVGGKAEFCDSLVEDPNSKPKKCPSYWNAQRLTGVTASSARDRHTLTTSDGKLFHYEFVPEGISFTVRVSGQNLSKDEIVYLLAALEGFNVQFPVMPVMLGASNSNGWGRFKWVLESIKRIDAEGVKNWIEQGAEGAGYSMLQEIPPEECGNLESEAKKFAEKAASEMLRLKVALKFDSLFLVNAPDVAETGGDETEDYHPRRNHEGKVILPVRSMRGALRSQAERIIRTLGAKACCVDDQAESCKSVKNLEDVNKLCLACVIFGSSGWQTTVNITDFVQSNEEVLMTEEFVAIDRFAGGAAEKKKFNAKAVYMPVLEGSISIGLKRLKSITSSGAGLITLLMRDLEEGDIVFGLGGGSKSYGTCLAEVKEEFVEGEQILTQSAVNDLRNHIKPQEQTNATTRP